MKIFDKYDKKDMLWLLPENEKKKHKKVFGAFGDVHLPYERPGALEFLVRTFIDNEVTHIINLGDLIDLLSVNSHGYNPQSPSQVEEFKRTMIKLNDWKEVFPEMIYIAGNHETRIERYAINKGIDPSIFLKNVSEVFDFPPGWNYKVEHIEDNIRFIHGDGDGNSGITPAYNVARNTNFSTVSGDKHTAQGVWYKSSVSGKRVFGCSVGCLVDSESIAFAYKRKPRFKDLYGAGIIYSSEYAKVVPFLEDDDNE